MNQVIINYYLLCSKPQKREHIFNSLPREKLQAVIDENKNYLALYNDTVIVRESVIGGEDSREDKHIICIY